MRDPDRINDILEELGKVWRKSPDMRLMQIIYGVLSSTKNIVYADDDEIYARLKLETGGTEIKAWEQSWREERAKGWSAFASMMAEKYPELYDQ